MVNYNAAKEALDSCKNPLFLFHDDTDGLCSFLQLYKYKRAGSWVIVKARPRIDVSFLRKVEEHNPDAVFIMDIAEVEQDFIDEAKRPIVWIDHHEPLDREEVLYCNPRLDGENIPSALLCYNIINTNSNKEDTSKENTSKKNAISWIAMVGSVADWHLPSWKEDFCKHYPALLHPQINRPEVALFESPVGKLARIISFLAKGQMRDVRKSIVALMKIKEPEELLAQTTETGAFLMRRYNQIEKEYFELREELEKRKNISPVLLFTYTENKTSFTGELATETIYRHPEKLVIVCREKSGEMRCSLRSTKREIPPMLKKALVGVQGYGGGHEYACGAGVKKEDFERFIRNLEEQLINS